MSASRGMPEFQISQADYLETLTREHQTEILLAQYGIAKRALIPGVALLNGSDYRSMMFTLDKYPLKVCEFMIVLIKDSILKNLQNDISYGEACLGLIYEKKNDLDIALRYYDRAEKRECAEAIFRKILLILKHPGLVKNPVEQGYALTPLAIADFVEQENFDRLIKMADAFKKLEAVILSRPKLEPYMPENAQKYASELKFIDEQFVAVLKDIPADAELTPDNALIFADLMQSNEKKFIPHGIVPQLHTDVLKKIERVLEAANADIIDIEHIQIHINKRMANQARRIHGAFKATAETTRQQVDASSHSTGMGNPSNG